MSPAFKKILPLIIIVTLVSLGWLFSTFDIFGTSGTAVSVARKADELRIRQSTLDAIQPFSVVMEDAYALQLIQRSKLPQDTGTGRSNPFLR